MKKTIYIIALTGLLGITAIWLLSNKRKAESRVFYYDKQQPVLISTHITEMMYLTDSILYTGTFEPFREGKVMGESQGKIISMNAEPGYYLKKGDQVAQLDNELLKLQLEAIEVQIKGLENDVQRNSILSQADAIQGVQLEKNLLALEAARIQRKTIKEQINRTMITAPFSGVVTQKFTELGTVISPMVPLIQLTDINLLKMTLNVPESDLKYFTNKQEVKVAADIYPNKQFKGNVSYVGSKGDPAHNYPVHILLTNTTENQIKAGMFGTVRIKAGADQEYPAVPLNAIAGSSVSPKVYVIENSKAVLRDVTVAYQNEEYAALSSGLKAGEVVAVSGFINLKNGSPVKTQKNN